MTDKPAWLASWEAANPATETRFIKAAAPVGGKAVPGADAGRAEA